MSWSVSSINTLLMWIWRVNLFHWDWTELTLLSNIRLIIRLLCVETFYNMLNLVERTSANRQKIPYRILSLIWNSNLVITRNTWLWKRNCAIVSTRVKLLSTITLDWLAYPLELMVVSCSCKFQYRLREWCQIKFLYLGQRRSLNNWQINGPKSVINGINHSHSAIISSQYSHNSLRLEYNQLDIHSLSRVNPS